MNVRSIMEDFASGKITEEEFKRKLYLSTGLVLETAMAKKWLLHVVDSYFLGEQYRKLYNSIRGF